MLFLYLPVNSAGVHPSGVSLDGYDSLSYSQIGPSFSHHTILLLTDEDCSSKTQIFSISENIHNTAVNGIIGLPDREQIYLQCKFLAWVLLKSKSGPLVCLVLNSKFWKQLATKRYRFSTDYIYLLSVVGFKTFSWIKTEERLIVQSSCADCFVTGTHLRASKPRPYLCRVMAAL